MSIVLSFCNFRHVLFDHSIHENKFIYSGNFMKL